MNKTKIAAIILGITLVGASIACGSPSTDSPVTTENKASKGYEVSVSSCSAESLAGIVKFDVSLTNTGKSAKTFFLTGEVTNGGTRLSDASGISNDLGAGQNAVVHMIAGTVPAGSSGFSCKISSVR